MIVVGTTVVLGDGTAGAASLPTATAANELLRSTGAGTTYEAVGQGDVVSDVLVAFLGSDPAGTAIISDGAGDVGPTSAAVSALLAATDAAGMRAALGVGSGTLASRPASPAAGDRYYATDFDVDLACRTAGVWGVPGVGALAVTRGPFVDTGAKMLTAAGVAVGPIGGPGTTLAMGLHVASLPGGSEIILAEYWSASNTSGWILGVSAPGGTANRLYLAHFGMDGTAKTEIGDLATGSYAIAISIAPTALRWSIKGGAAANVAISGTYTPPGADASFVIGGHVTGGFAPTGVSFAWLQSWGATLSDAVLQAITATHATYLPGESGATPVAAYLAGRTRRDALAAEAVGSQVALLTVPSTLGWTAR